MKGQNTCFIKIDTIKSAFDSWERYILNIPEFYHSPDGKTLKINVEKYTGTHWISLSITHSSVWPYDYVFLVIEYENGQNDTLYQNNTTGISNSLEVIYTSKGVSVLSEHRNPYGKKSAPLRNLSKPWKSIRLVNQYGYQNDLPVKFIFTSQETWCINNVMETVITFLDD